MSRVLRSRASAVLVVGLSVTVGFGPSAAASPPVLAVAPDATTATATADAPRSELDEVQRLYEEGRAAYETFNYDAAIKSWTTALARVPSTAEAASVRNALVYNMARAQQKAYELDNDLLRLKRARLLLARYLEEEGAAGSGDPEDLARVQTQLDELDAQIAAVENPVAPTVAPTKPATPDEPPPAKPSRRGAVMIGVGAGLLVAGAGLLAGMGTGIAMSSRAEKRLGELDTLEQETERPDVVDRGELGNRLAIATGIVGGVALVAGTALVIVGARERTRARASLGMMAPMLGAGAWGFTAKVRL